MSLVSAVIGGLIVLGALAGYSALLPERKPREIASNTVNRQVVPVKQADGLLAPQEIYDRFGPSVVHVRATITQYGQDFFGIPYPNSGRSDGSGFVIDASGYIVTNAHVVDNANKVTVILADKTQLPARVMGIDRSSDLALLKISPGKRSLAVIQLGDSSKVRVGDTVYAIGNPFGLDGSMSSGIVSAIGRQIEAPNGFSIRNVIQTDAAVNPGNSGGPLIDAYGQVVGVNSQIESRAEQFAGIAFAIPSNTVKNIVNELRQKGQASHAWLGIQGTDVTDEMAEKAKLPTNRGVIISNVIPGGPGEKAGLRGMVQTGGSSVAVGDVIVELDGAPVATMEDLLTAVEKHRVGERVKLDVIRAGKRESIYVTLGERPEGLVQR